MVAPVLVVEPPQAVVFMFDAGIVIIGLTPLVFISVAPSGIAPAVRFDPGPESGDAVPLEETFEDAAAQLADAEASPPPSKVEFELAAELPLADGPDEGDPFDAQLALAGLNPPGSISVAPSGIPVPLD